MQGSCLQLGAISYYFDKSLLKTYGEHNLLSIIHLDLDNTSFGSIAYLVTKKEEP